MDDQHAEHHDKEQFRKNVGAAALAASVVAVFVTLAADVGPSPHERMT